LIDKSALVRLSGSSDAELWVNRVARRAGADLGRDPVWKSDSRPVRARSCGPPSAEYTDLTVLPLDKDFDLIVDVSGQAVERSSVP